MSDDLLGTVKAACGVVFSPMDLGDSRVGMDASAQIRYANKPERWVRVTWDQIRALVARCEQAEADLAAQRQRHPEAVEAAFREGWLERGLLPDYGMPPLHSCNAAWLASDARKAVARDNG